MSPLRTSSPCASRCVSAASHSGAHGHTGPRFRPWHPLSTPPQRPLPSSGAGTLRRRATSLHRSATPSDRRTTRRSGSDARPNRLLGARWPTVPRRGTRHTAPSTSPTSAHRRRTTSPISPSTIDTSRCHRRVQSPPDRAARSPASGAVGSSQPSSRHGAKRSRTHPVAVNR